MRPSKPVTVTFCEQAGNRLASGHDDAASKLMRNRVLDALASPGADISAEDVFAHLCMFHQAYAEGMASGQGREIALEVLLAEFKRTPRRVLEAPET